MDTSLIIPVDSITEPRQPFERALSRELLEGMLETADAYDVKAGAKLVVHLTRLSGRDVLLEGRTTLSLESACRRCLKPVASDVPASFTLNMVARPLDAGGKPRKDDDDGDDEKAASFDDQQADEESFDGERINLGAVAREQLLLALPTIEPLCLESCKGLCAQCGHDLNESDCGHRFQASDPRWSALKNLKV